MTDLDSNEMQPQSAAAGSRIVFALRQAGFMAVALLVAGRVTDRLRPADVIDRDIASTSFLWAIVIWLAVLVFHAVAFEQSQMRDIESAPLLAAALLGAFVFLTGLVSFDGPSLGAGIAYLFANAVGAVMFWWGLFSLGYLIHRRS